MFDQIPLKRPDTPLLDTINDPADLKKLEVEQLEVLARELREYLLYSVGQTGGHFGAGLGVVELTIALHYVLNTPDDRLVWDVGHQTYPHKILTGRREELTTMRHKNGLAGFPKRSESPYDTFGVGHSSTSISAALGMAIGKAQVDSQNHSVAVIGDGAMTAGMAFEALNHAAHVDTNMMVILNDNNMSISPNVGGLATYFSKIWASKTYTALREGSKRVLTKIPQAWELARKTEEHMKGMVSPGTLFEELGFYYVGPIDGHDIERLVHDIGNMLEIKGPKLLHIITRKGKGYTPAEDDPVGYHALNKIEPNPKVQVATGPKKKKYQDVFGDWLCDVAQGDPHLIGITPAMCEGSGMVEFAERFPEQYHDVAIAEQHAVTLAAGLACEEFKPVVAIYSTFLQRAYDQLVHDVALQDLNVTFAIDRAGVVGEDGPTHAGSFDISYLRCIPNMVIASPSDENECRQLLFSAYHHQGPAAVRYPRGTGTGQTIIAENLQYPVGKGKVIREGQGVCILNFGVLLPEALKVAEQYNYTVCDMRWVKPLDAELILEMAEKHAHIVTLEENAIAGGAGSGVIELLMTQGIALPVLPIGLPDSYLDHGKREELLADAGLDVSGIESNIQGWVQKIRMRLATTQPSAANLN
ncbi:1-deoxy-D-xylulose-5-phosphate synthase [Teredinibacter sp. KSP-S5-2]|uniref:1-deoxy-D-xylulose-5-phosphate synthase n=1 Tax=Teredinibacter sp. KSP-S5-2 TaxID=3034506 RepID=UPI0029348DD4|nr:1-deoxy-D-xylulose-5-phosphate synthase [Teredinibacter sp. KSP-S5-2]WNO09458.1 1-deoxy-D-xylulose-5-phosphate synthase [Teredinibacter sp. KSP-S5-2]